MFCCGSGRQADSKFCDPHKPPVVFGGKNHGNPRSEDDEQCGSLVVGHKFRNKKGDGTNRHDRKSSQYEIAPRCVVGILVSEIAKIGEHGNHDAGKGRQNLIFVVKEWH